MDNNKVKKYIISPIATALVLAILYFSGAWNGQGIVQSDLDLEGPYEVERVVDGDTIIVRIDGEKTRVRLIGIDTPESVADESIKENTPEGKEASEYAKNLLTGATVYFEYDEGRTDTYDRVLAYVYLSDKKTMVNELLLQKGLAKTIVVQPNVKYKDRLAEAQQSAKENNEGFWGTGFFK